MTRILHLSDLHFGMESPEKIVPLAEAVRACAADLVVVSGDLTQRARRGQFWAAQRFLASLQTPVMMVPGNHDVPLFNIAARLLSPFGGYRRHVARVLAPSLRLSGAQIVSFNTADPYRWRRGHLRRTDLDKLLRELDRTPRDPDRPLILVCHHPLVAPPGFRRDETRGPVEEALSRLEGLGLRLVLSGHLHHWSVGPGISASQPQRVFHLQAGTALCARAGETGHGFAEIELTADQMTVAQHLWQGEMGRFEREPPRNFHWGAEGWRPELDLGPGLHREGAAGRRSP